MMKSILFLSILLFCNELSASQIGTASWYGPGFHGKRTASGDKFNKHSLTAAHKTIKLGTKVKVTNLFNNKSVIVLINDRGPYSRGRIIDLSQAAKNQLEMGGTTKVSIEIIR